MHPRALLLLPVLLLACASLPEILTAVGPVVGAVEAVISAAQKAGTPPTDPAYVKALAEAKAIDAARAQRDASAAKDRASIIRAERDEARKLAGILAAVSKAAPPCPTCAVPVCVADAGEAWHPAVVGWVQLDGGMDGGAR